MTITSCTWWWHNNGSKFFWGLQVRRVGWCLLGEEMNIEYCTVSDKRRNWKKNQSQKRKNFQGLVLRLFAWDRGMESNRWIGWSVVVARCVGVSLLCFACMLKSWIDELDWMLAFDSSFLLFGFTMMDRSMNATIRWDSRLDVWMSGCEVKQKAYLVLYA